MKNTRKFYEMVSESDACREFTESKFADSTFPDAAFIVEKGNSKSSKTGNSKNELRHLPHHSKTAKSDIENSSVDIKQLRAALYNVDNVKTSMEDSKSYISRARKHLEKHVVALLKSKKATTRAMARALCEEFRISKAEQHVSVNVMFDVGTKEMVLVVNGMVQSFTDLSLDRFVDFEGEVFSSFSFDSQNVDKDGLLTRTTFRARSSVAKKHLKDIKGKKVTDAFNNLESGTKVNVTYDVETADMKLFINNEQTEFVELHISKFTFSDGDVDTSFFYTQREDTGDNVVVEVTYMAVGAIQTPVKNVPVDPVTDKRFKEQGLTDRGGPSLVGPQKVIENPVMPAPKDQQENPDFEKI